MLVQVRSDGLRLIRQHEHALLSGKIAAHWRGAPPADALPWRVVVAASLHDWVWQDEDVEPRWDPDRRAPHSFLTLPAAARETRVLGRLDELRTVDPDVGALVELHHRTLAGDAVVPPELETPLRWVRFFDLLSLVVCLGLPDAEPESRPGWLPDTDLEPPEGGRVAVEWTDPGRMRLRPFPFEAPLHLHVPYRRLPRGPFVSADALVAAWWAASEATYRTSLLP